MESTSIFRTCTITTDTVGGEFTFVNGHSVKRLDLENDTAFESPATNPGSAVAPWEVPRSVIRHLGNSEVEFVILRNLSDVGKICSAP